MHATLDPYPPCEKRLLVPVGFAARTLPRRIPRALTAPVCSPNVPDTEPARPRTAGRPARVGATADLHTTTGVRFLRRRCACGNRLPRERRAHVRAKGRHGSAFPTRRVTVRCVPRLLAAATRAYTCRDARQGVLTGTSSCRLSCKSAVPVAKSELRCPVECFFAFIKSLGAFRVFLQSFKRPVNVGPVSTISDQNQEIKIPRGVCSLAEGWQVAARLVLVWTRA